jgi:ABC-2 type transport system permease protein
MTTVDVAARPTRAAQGVGARRSSFLRDVVSIAGRALRAVPREKETVIPPIFTVLDIQGGYFDRLLLTPVRRLAILIGHMVADVTVACTLTLPIVALAFALGVHLQSGPLGLVVFIVMAGLWSLAFAGFGYAIALKTGNPAAVNSSFLLFFPFLFMTSSYVPRSQLTGWLNTVASWNPVTYVLRDNDRSSPRAGSGTNWARHSLR